MYKVTKKLYVNGKLSRAEVSIKGHKFTIQKNGLRYEWIKTISVNKDGSSVEIDWDTCDSGLHKIGKELGLKFHQSSSVFSMNYKNSYFTG